MQERAPLTARTSIKIAAITFAVLTAISLFVLFSLPKTYVAVTRVEVAKFVAPNDSQQNLDPYFIQNEFEQIKSSAVLTRAYRELLANPQFKNVARTRAPQDDTVAARALLAGLDLRQARNTSLIEIRYSDRAPQNAALIANTIAHAYASEAKARNSGEVRILDLAQAPARPASPNVPLLLAIATILNSLLAVMAGFFAANLFR